MTEAKSKSSFENIGLIWVFDLSPFSLTRITWITAFGKLSAVRRTSKFFAITIRPCVAPITSGCNNDFNHTITKCEKYWFDFKIIISLLFWYYDRVKMFADLTRLLYIFGRLWLLYFPISHPLWMVETSRQNKIVQCPFNNFYLHQRLEFT